MNLDVTSAAPRFPISLLTGGPLPAAPLCDQLVTPGRLLVDSLQITHRQRKKCIEVKCGSVTIKVYPVRWRDKRFDVSRSAFKIRYFEMVEGRSQARNESRALKTDALDRADQIAKRLANEQSFMLNFGPDQLARHLANEKTAARIGRDSVSLLSEKVSDEEKKAVLGLSHVTQDQLLHNWRDSHPADLDERHIPKIVEEFLLKRNVCGHYRRNLSKMLERFASRFDCPFSRVQARTVDDWLDSLNVGLRTRRNHRGAVMTLLSFARTRNYVRKDWHGLDQVDNPEPPKTSVPLYSPEELALLLHTAESYPGRRRRGGRAPAPYRKLVPLIAITAFAGVRHGEMNEEKIEHLDWSDIDWQTKRIFIDDGAAKQTGRNAGDGRWVDMPDVLIEWLSDYRKSRGKICELANTSNALCRLRKLAGITGPKKNALRKSFITYKLALSRDVNGVADLAGNSPSVIKKNYKGAQHTRLVEVAQAWFRVKPDRAQLQFNL